MTKDQVERIAQDSVRELGVSCRILAVFQPPLKPATWCINFLAANDSFQVTVELQPQPDPERIKQVIKAELQCQQQTQIQKDKE